MVLMMMRALRSWEGPECGGDGADDDESAALMGDDQVTAPMEGITNLCSPSCLALSLQYAHSYPCVYCNTGR